MDCLGTLWFAVLMQAVEDASILVPDAHPLTEQHYYQRTALLWFKNSRCDVGSFIWVCNTLNVEPEEVLQRVRDRREANRRTR
jgi:hypothetical protein